MYIHTTVLAISSSLSTCSSVKQNCVEDRGLLQMACFKHQNCMLYTAQKSQENTNLAWNFFVFSKDGPEIGAQLKY